MYVRLFACTPYRVLRISSDHVQLDVERYAGAAVHSKLVISGRRFSSVQRLQPRNHPERFGFLPPLQWSLGVIYPPTNVPTDGDLVPTLTACKVGALLPLAERRHAQR